MTQPINFDEEPQEELEPLSFILNGQDFNCIPTWPAAALTDVAAAVDDQTGMKQLRMIGEFFDMVLTAESAARFQEGLRSRDKPISLGRAVEVTQKLMTAYMNRPTGGSSESSSGPTTIPSSTAPALSAVSAL